MLSNESLSQRSSEKRYILADIMLRYCAVNNTGVGRQLREGVNGSFSAVCLR